MRVEIGANFLDPCYHQIDPESFDQRTVLAECGMNTNLDVFEIFNIRGSCCAMTRLFFLSSLFFF